MSLFFSSFVDHRLPVEFPKIGTVHETGMLIDIIIIVVSVDTCSARAAYICVSEEASLPSQS